ncbi:unnamed protein product [Chironomus riparius]|uniref:Calcium-activated chloride channel N-terminal domain-containing protein n=1 Tax=Chironomus riparius TaxID=315576 RepID=A0A9N9WYF9_9DIPT|nr:unnamed protein product [Chironomus riparius]
MKMSSLVKLLCLMLCIVCAQSVIVRNGVYDNLVIEIQKDVSDEDCSRFLATLENTLSASSQHLHQSLDGRIYFSSFEIIIPSTWSYNCLTNSSTVTSYNGASTDVQITKSNPIFGDYLWTQQSGGCGEHGDQIYVSERSIRDDFQNIEKKFANEFMKYRYGVFDKNGFDGDAIYPKCSASGNPMCTDALALDSHSYNKYMPTKQNQLCDRMSPMDVILRNVDFNGTQRNQNFTAPTFNYVRKMSTRYMLLLDDHADISIRDSFGFLRDSIRKWLDKDLIHHGTEVGIIKLNSNNASDPIKSISGSDDREEIMSNLPFSVTNRGGYGKCNVYPAIMKSVNIMQERSNVHGDAISSIILIGPGMYNCSEEIMTEIIEKCKSANIKIVTVNYPIIGINRVPMDELAIKTEGEAFTVLEKKKNEDKSSLATFFELTNVFMYISAKFHHGDASELPIEIYRKELIDSNTSGDSTKSRTYTDSFNVDDTTKNINFFVYNYDRKELGSVIEDISLTSPNQVSFSRISELRSDYHQLTLVGNLSGIGSWHYNIKRFYGNQQPHFVQVLAYPKIDTNNFITARAWIKRPSTGAPNIIYAEVMQGSLPILDALVEVVVRQPSGRDERIQLFDSGNSDPDVTKGDGVYSRYYTVDEPGMYRFSIKITDNGNTAYSQIDRDPSKQIHCCGSAITTQSKQPVTPFTRYITPITLFISAEEIENEKSKIPFIGRIGDLHVVPQTTNGSEKVTLEWTGPDTGSEISQISYEIRYTFNLKDIVDNFDVIGTVLHLGETIPHSIGQGASVTLNLANEHGLIGVPFYVAIRTINEEVSTGPISNVVRVFVPKRRPTASPSYTHIDNDMYESDPSMEPVDDDETVGIFRNAKLAGIPWQILVPVIICCIIVFIIITIYCWCCVFRKRTYSDAKKPTKSPSKPSISVITPTTPSYQPQPVQQNQYHMDPVTNGNSHHSYLVDVPDHHTIGLPMMDDDMMKPDFSDHDKMLIEEMKQQQRFQQQALLDAYGDQQQILSSTLTRNGQYLSPYESWSASTLLAEHEVRQSPLDHEGSIMYVDANGEMVPPIPPHPYNVNNGGTYGYVDQIRQPPPTYTSVYRPLVRGVPGQGSMQSVVSSAMMSNGDPKKIRNVTMV